MCVPLFAKLRFANSPLVALLYGGEGGFRSLRRATKAPRLGRRSLFEKSDAKTFKYGVVWQSHKQNYGATIAGTLFLRTPVRVILNGELRASHVKDLFCEAKFTLDHTKKEYLHSPIQPTLFTFSLKKLKIWLCHIKRLIIRRGDLRSPAGERSSPLPCVR